MGFPLSNFEDYVSKKILDRGYNYYRLGAILELTISAEGDWYDAIVEGTDEYEVGVYIEKGKIIRCSCDCPYSYGPICKHQVAVFFRIREEYKDLVYEKVLGETSINSNKKASPKKKKQTPQKTISIPPTPPAKKQNVSSLPPAQQIMAQLTNDDLVKWLLLKFRVQSNLEQQFLSDFAHLLESKTINYPEMVQDVFGNAYDLIDVISQLRTLLDGKASNLKVETADEAIGLTQAILPHAFGFYEHEQGQNADWEIEMLLDDAFELLLSVNDLAISTERRQALFQYAFKQIDSSLAKDWDFKHHFVRLGVATATTYEEILLLRAYLKQEDKDEYSSFIRSLNKKEKQHLKEQEKQETPPPIIKIKYQFKNKPVEKAYQKKQYEKVMELALAGIEEAEKGGYEDLLHDCQVWMLKAAQAMNDITEIITWSVSLFLDTGELAYYQLLKKYSPPRVNWQQKSNHLIQQLIGSQETFPVQNVAAIYIEEKRFEDLLELVQTYPTKANLELYQVHLEKRFKKEWAKLNK